MVDTPTPAQLETIQWLIENSEPISDADTTAPAAAPKHTPAPTDVARMRNILRALGMRRAIELLADASEQEAEAPGYSTPISFAFRTNASILRGLIGRLFPDR